MSMGMDTLELISKMTGALAIILGLVFLFAYAVRRLGLAGHAIKKGYIEVLENKAILPKRYISLVRVAGNYFLVGSTEHGITLLGSVDKEGLKGFDDILADTVKESKGGNN